MEAQREGAACPGSRGWNAAGELFPKQVCWVPEPMSRECRTQTGDFWGAGGCSLKTSVWSPTSETEKRGGRAEETAVSKPPCVRGS